MKYMKRIEMIEDNSFKGVLEWIDQDGAVITWDDRAPDGHSRWVRYKDIPDTMKRIRFIET